MLDIDEHTIVKGNLCTIEEDYEQKSSIHFRNKRVPLVVKVHQLGRRIL
jgi:hypothetical protein